jgi:hypothetical protein
LCGTFLYVGEPPTAQKLKITKDQEECCRHHLVDESLVVDKASRGIKNVVICLWPGPDQTVPVHERYLEGQRAITLDNLACRFDPRIVLLWTTDALIIGNSDPIGHNVMIDTRKNPPVNVTIPSGARQRHQFLRQEPEPVAVSCSIHPWMRGWVVIRNTPYMAVTDDNGEFILDNLPVGTWDFACWHERAGFLTDVVRGGMPVKWRRGRLRVEIRPGENDLGTIELQPPLFER